MTNQHAITSRAIIAYILATLFLFFVMGLQASPSVMTNELMRAFQIDAAGLGIMASVYFYTYTFMQIPAGLSFDVFNLRKLLTSAVLVCTLGAFIFVLASNAMFAGTGRLFMGFGSAFAFIAVLVIADKWFPARYFAFLVGLAQLLAAFGAMSGEVPLAALVESLGWRETIHWIVGIGVCLAALVWLFVRDKAKTDADTPKTSIRENLKTIIFKRQTWWVALYAFTNWAPVLAFAALWGIPFLADSYGISETLAATAVSMIWLGQGVASPIVGWLSDKMGRRCRLMSWTALLGVVSASLVIYISNLPLLAVFILLFLFGIATSGQLLTFAVVKDINPSSVVATAIGFNNMALVAGGPLFQPLIGLILRYVWQGNIVDGVPIYSAADYKIALLVIPVCFALSFIASSVFIKETFCNIRHPAG